MRSLNGLVLVLGSLGLLFDSLTDITWLCIHLQPEDFNVGSNPFHFHGQSMYRLDDREPIATCSLYGANVMIPAINYNEHFAYDSLTSQPWVAQAEQLFGANLQVDKLAFLTRAIKLACNAVASVCLIAIVMLLALSIFERQSPAPGYVNLNSEPGAPWLRWLGQLIMAMASAGLAVVVIAYVQIYFYLRMVFLKVFTFMGREIRRPPVLGLREGCGLALVSLIFIFFGGRLVAKESPDIRLPVAETRRVRATM